MLAPVARDDVLLGFGFVRGVVVDGSAWVDADGWAVAGAGEVSASPASAPVSDPASANG